MNNFGERVTFIWGVVDLLRDAFRRSKYADVIRSLTVLRRIDCVLEPTKEAVIKGKLENLAPSSARLRGSPSTTPRPSTLSGCWAMPRTALISAAVTGKIDVREEM